MNILSIPFHKFMYIKESIKRDFLFMLEDRSELKNHLDSIHASAQVALAEATSGQFLLEQFKEIQNKVIPVIRRTQMKYHRPGCGSLYSKSDFLEGDRKCFLSEYNKRNRFITKVRVKIFDEHNYLIATAVFEWFISKK